MNRILIETDSPYLEEFAHLTTANAQRLFGLLGQIDKRYLMWYHLMIGKIRRGNYVFVTWVGDHPPRHVHVYRDGKLVVKWDLENQVAMKGQANRRILTLIGELEQEGRL